MFKQRLSDATVIGLFVQSRHVEGEVKMDKQQLIEQLEEHNQEDIVDASTNAPGLDNPEGIRIAVAKIREKKTKTGKVYGVETEEEKRNNKQNRRLTTKMHMFVNNLLSGQTPALAYRNAYNVRTDNNATVLASANKLMQDPRISTLLEALSEDYRRKVIDNAVHTREHVMSELFKHARQAKQEGTQLKALELMGRAVGMFTDKVEQKVEEISTEKLKEELKTHLSLLDNVQPLRKRKS